MKSFSSIFNERVLSGKLKPYQKNLDRGQMRKKLNWVPDSHRADLKKNMKIEKLKKQVSGKEMLTLSDIIYIINNYILQSNDNQCNASNVGEIANKYLKKPKSLGTTGITIKRMNNNSPSAKFYIYK